MYPLLTDQHSMASRASGNHDRVEPPEYISKHLSRSSHSRSRSCSRRWSTLTAARSPGSAFSHASTIATATCSGHSRTRSSPPSTHRRQTAPANFASPPPESRPSLSPSRSKSAPGPDPAPAAPSPSPPPSPPASSSLARTIGTVRSRIKISNLRRSRTSTAAASTETEKQEEDDLKLSKYKNAPAKAKQLLGVIEEKKQEEGAEDCSDVWDFKCTGLDHDPMAPDEYVGLGYRRSRE
ncbi:hypothetical protein BZA05DRAFT_476483 [Tricharina praecox]|uniref:uncharacterized protein n=1 Tax=Tricharina praecox TaxID=43433 RepID=UPI00221F799F|nr:uncharacterized protein BZA05DRAFT_476483 [Tricharina praecox]KAI5845544.1 hypothetical protein BZA05DRAFT_476483 [Tricharina praecox]